MMDIQITKSKGIDGLVSGYSPQLLEEEKELSVRSNILRKYKRFLDGFYCSLNKGGVDMADYFVDDILDPGGIKAFLQLSGLYREHKEYPMGTGIFLTNLLVNSVKAGYDHFHLNQDLPISELCDMEIFEEIPPYSITIDGNLGSYCFQKANLCRVEIFGNVGVYFAKRALNSTFTINGRVGYGFGRSAAICTFKSRDRTTVSRMELMVSQKMWGKPSLNRIIFIHPYGEEEVVADYNRA